MIQNPNVCKCKRQEAESKTEMSISRPVRNGRPRVEWNRDLYQTTDQHIVLQRQCRVTRQLVCKSSFLLLFSIYHTVLTTQVLECYFKYCYQTNLLFFYATYSTGQYLKHPIWSKLKYYVIQSRTTILFGFFEPWGTHLACNLLSVSKIWHSF